ncbi:hypothetical protein [Lactococcus garvieae]|uniref:Uncharacterized protein n=1 Tax=Lactococcus garvieae TaxID=1363 RepID=A0AAX3NDR7_9LACT|nr:hypothetical protein [Lactococcus garvieae]WEA14817.1 hypothetical protein PWF74_04735 [Lactococcus garvieae]
MSKENKVEQPAGMKPMTAEERKEYGLPPLEEEQHDVETKGNA